MIIVNIPKNTVNAKHIKSDVLFYVLIFYPLIYYFNGILLNYKYIADMPPINDDIIARFKVMAISDPLGYFRRSCDGLSYGSLGLDMILFVF